MRHITVLYGDENTGREYICRTVGWLYISGTPEEIKAGLEANTHVDEIGIPLLTASDDVGPVRSILHEHVKAHDYLLRYIDFRISL